MTVERSCGAVVFTREGGAIRYVLVRQVAGHCGFPKGHMEGAETEQETALREISEEVGLHPHLIDGFRFEEEYMLPNKPGVLKRVVYFLAEYENQTPVCQPEEVSEIVLTDYETALKTLTYQSARDILTAADEFLKKQ